MVTGEDNITVTALLYGKRYYTEQAMLSTARDRHSFLLFKIETLVTDQALSTGSTSNPTWKADHFCQILNENLDNQCMNDIAWHFNKWPKNPLEEYMAGLKQTIWVDAKYYIDPAAHSFVFIVSVYAELDDFEADGKEFARDYEQAIFLNKLTSGLE